MCADEADETDRQSGVGVACFEARPRREALWWVTHPRPSFAFGDR